MSIEISKSLKDTTVKHIMEGKITRRDFLKLGGVAAGLFVLEACGIKTAGEPTQTSVPITENPILPNMDGVEPNPDKFSTNKVLTGIDNMKAIRAPELERLKSRAELAARKIGLNLSDPLYETGLFGIKLQDGSGGEINHLFVSRSLKANAPLPTVGPTSNEADEAGLFFLADVDYPYFVAPGQGEGDAVMFPIVGYETDKGFALGLGTPNPDGRTYTSTFGFCEININYETNKAEGVTYVDPFSGNYKNYNPENVPTELEKMYTKVLPMPIAQEEPTATSEVREMDLDINHEQEVVMEYMGVKINSSLITDKSLDPVIKEVTISNESAYAEFIARSIHKVWLQKGGVNGTGPETETSFEDFMKLWATAQKSGLTEDWEKVQLKNIWANDLKDGNGYVQKPETLWMMYDGQAPEGVRGIGKMSVALVKATKTENITVLNQDNQGYGTNITNNDLIIYHSMAMSVGPKARKSALAQGISGIAWWLTRNSGSAISGYLNDDLELTNLLLKNNFSIK
jgi:hypothetical protein